MISEDKMRISWSGPCGSKAALTLVLRSLQLKDLPRELWPAATAPTSGNMVKDQKMTTTPRGWGLRKLSFNSGGSWGEAHQLDLCLHRFTILIYQNFSKEFQETRLFWVQQFPPYSTIFLHSIGDFLLPVLKESLQPRHLLESACLGMWELVLYHTLFKTLQPLVLGLHNQILSC